MRVARLLTTLATATALRTTRRALAAGAAAAALGPPRARRRRVALRSDKGLRRDEEAGLVRQNPAGDHAHGHR